MALSKLRLFSLLSVVCLLAPMVPAQVLSTDASDPTAVPADYELSAMRYYNRTILLAKENYVDPSRFKERDMLVGALTAIEQLVPEVMIGDIADDKILVQIGSFTTSVSVEKMYSLWDLSFKVRDFFRLFEKHLPKTTNFRDIEYAAINGTLSKLDPHSNFMEARLSNEVRLRMKGEFGGLGVVIGVRDGVLTVISPIEGTPADKAGIKSKDRVIKIGEDSTANMDLDRAVDKLRGKPGTTANLTVERARESTPRKFRIVRDIIKVESVTDQLIAKDIGYIRLKEFQGNSAADITSRLSQLKNKSGGALKGLILDFRGNPGGLLEQSVSISDLFLDGGEIVIQEARSEKREVKYANPGSEKLKLPLIVLVNGGSASASEIVAGAIKNRKRGLVLGEQTFGKGSVQVFTEFPDRSALKLTMAHYLTPGDESIQSVGITPDIEIHQAHVKDLSSLSLFEKELTREENLEFHLDDKARTIERKSSFELSYLDNEKDADENERTNYSTKFKQDFDISLATRILKATKSSAHSDMMAAAATVVEATREEEATKIAAALKKLGIDWSSAPKGSTSSLKISAQVAKPATAKAGDSLEIKIDAKNIGTEPIYQAYGISDSQSSYLKGREFIFGKLEPAQQRTFAVKIKLPKSALTSRDLLRVKFFGNGGKEMNVLNVPIQIDGLPRPVFAYSAFIDDSRHGNGDGSLEAGEKVDMVLQVKNVGKGAANEPIILLKNTGGSELDIDEGRKKMPALKPGETAIERLTFSVREKAKLAKLQVLIYDEESGAFWKEKMEIGVRPLARQVLKVSGRVVISEPTDLYDGPEQNARVIANVPAQARGEQLVSIGDKVRVRFSPMLSGFVKKNAIKTTREAKLVAKKSTPTPAPVYFRVPPKIEFANIGEQPVVAKGNFHLDAKIQDHASIRDAYVILNDRKVLYREFNKPAAAGVKLETDLKLKPGVNFLTLVAREDENYDQRETLVVFSEVGDPLEKKQVANN